MSVNTSVELHYKFYLYVALPFRQKKKKKGNNDSEIRLAHWSTAVAKKSPKWFTQKKEKEGKIGFFFFLQWATFPSLSLTSSY